VWMIFYAKYNEVIVGTVFAKMNDTEIMNWVKWVTIGVQA
jgi:hypothetical protein